MGRYGWEEDEEMLWLSHFNRSLLSSGVITQEEYRKVQAAIAREDNPELSLTELAAMMEPPITKPAMNHRLKKLVFMAKETEK